MCVMIAIDVYIGSIIELAKSVCACRALKMKQPPGCYMILILLALNSTYFASAQGRVLKSLRIN